MYRLLILTLLTLLTGISVAQQPELTIPLGHSKLIYDVAYSPDGKYAASGSADRTVKIWELEKGREVRTIFIDIGYATSVEFSPDSKRLLVGGGNYDVGILHIFDLETGQKTVDMKGLEEYAWTAAFSPDGKYVYSASFDGTVRKWDAASGKQIASAPERPEICRDLAVDPTGEFLVATNDEYDEWNVSIYRTEDMKLVRPLWLPEMFQAQSVAWSPDGRFIATGGWVGQVAIFNRNSSEPMAVFDACNDKVSALAFGKDGSVIFVASDDGIISAWDHASQRHLGNFTGHKDRVYSIDVHPSQPLLLSGGSFDKSLKEWSTETFMELRNLQGDVYPVKALSLSEDGRQLLINTYDEFGGDAFLWNLDRLDQVKALGYPEESYEFMDRRGDTVLIGSRYGLVRKIELPSGEIREAFDLGEQVKGLRLHPRFDNIYVSLRNSNEEYYYGYYYLDPEAWAVYPLPTEGEPVQGEQYLSYAASGEAYYLMENAWSKYRITRFVDSTAAATMTLTDSALLFPGFAVSPDERTILTLRGRGIACYDGLTGEKLWMNRNLPAGEVSWVEFLDEDRILLSGGDWSSGYVAVYDLATQEVVRLRDDFTSQQQVVIVDSERNLFISGGEDARITFMDASTFQTRVTLFTFADSPGDWAAVHPSGLFDGSKAAIESYLYYTYRLEPIELFQMKERYYEPGLLQKVLGYNAEPLRDVQQFSDVQLYPKAGLKVTGDELEVRLEPRNGGVGRISFLINGKEMIRDLSSRVAAKDGDGGTALFIPLDHFSKFLIPGEPNRLEVITTNASGSLTSPVYSTSYEAPLPTGFVQGTERPVLHALIIGTSDYRGETLDLNYASKDAEDMANAIGIGGSKLFGPDHLRIHLLNTDQEDPALLPSKANIAAVFRSIAEEARPEDILFLYFSGHGVTWGDDDAQFHYLTRDVSSGDISDPQIRELYTVSTSDMIDWIKSTPAQKQILILDACASGQAVDDLLSLSKNVNSSQIKAFDRMKDRTGLFIVAGSAASKVSYEASQFGQSLLTYALLNNMNLVSARNENGFLDLIEWINESKEDVPELAGSIGGIQEPVVAIPRQLSSFDIAQITRDQMIPVAAIKPVFVRSTLMDMDEMDDVLALSERIDRHFSELASKGKHAQVVFVDVRDFPSAYSVKGLYQQTGDQVEITATLRRGEEKLGIISVSGPATDPDGLTDKIIGEVQQLLNK